MTNLLIRLYDDYEGNIYMDGRNIKDTSPSVLRKKFGMVFQDTFLFSGTLKENILFSRPNETDEELENAIETSGVGIFARNLKDGIETYIGGERCLPFGR